MSSANTNYTLYKFDIVTLFGTYDLRSDIITFELYEDIYSNMVVGFVDIIETENIIENYSMIGEEKIEIDFSVVSVVSGKGKSYTIKNRKSLVFDIQKIEERKIKNNKSMAMRIWFMSENFSKNMDSRVRKYYRGTQDAIVSRILQSQLGVGLKRVDACVNEEEYIFPNWHPFSAIDFMTRNSVSAAYNDPDYLFFEDMNGYHYVSMSYLMDQPLLMPSSGDAAFKEKTIQEFADRSTDYNIEKKHDKKGFDNIERYSSGMLGTTLIHHDMVNRKWRQVESNYQATFGKFKHNEKAKLTFEIGTSANKKNRFLYVPVNSIESPGPYVDEVMKIQHQDRAIRKPQTNQNLFVFEMAADPNMKIGYPLKFEYWNHALDKGKDMHDLYWGKYLVTKIRHSFLPQKYSMYVELTKDSYWS